MLIDCFQWRNAHHFGDAFAGQFELRKQVFVDAFNWQLSHVDDMEYDIYDTPGAVYLTYRDETGKVRGSARQTPTTLPYLLEDQFAYTVDTMALPHAPNIWEGSKLVLAPDLERQDHDRILNELTYAMVEFGVLYGVTTSIGLMRIGHIERVKAHYGWQIELLGKPHQIDGHQMVAIANSYNKHILRIVGEKTGISGSALNLAPSPPERSIAP
jgi:N-acyl-L-homoserine lactone synthetase